MVKEMLCILTASMSVLVVDTVLQFCKMLPLKGPGYKGHGSLGIIQNCVRTYNYVKIKYLI